LVDNHTDIRGIDDLRAMREGLGPEFRRGLQDMGPALGELHFASILHAYDICNKHFF